MFSINKRNVQQVWVFSGIVTAALMFSFHSHIADASSKRKLGPPGRAFDMSHWTLSVPVDSNGDKKADNISVKALKKYSHKDFFYLDSKQYMVFTAPNKSPTTKNSKNSRTELRQMIAGDNRHVKSSNPKNNFALAANPHARIFGSTGGKMSATLSVDHVARRAKVATNRSAYSVVVGQIHAGKVDGVDADTGFGFGNEPLKIFYKKFPGHNTGSVFWKYERNLSKGNPDRKDIAYPVWGGDSWLDGKDPGTEGIELGEVFNYEVNVHNNIMYLSFKSYGHPDVEYKVDLSNNINPLGEADPLDNPKGYTGDWFYFKAGAYNQCNVEKTKCLGTGNWELDKKNGDYASVVFRRIRVSDSTPPIQ